MRIDILTLFPDNMDRMLHESILGRACRKGLLDLHCVQIRDYTENRQNQVDDYPYGGGFGCIMMAQPLKSCVEAVLARGEIPREKTCVIAMTPQGTPFRQETARRLQRDYDRLVLVCGHYEGMDERFLEACVDEELSLGDFVLTGGEIAAMAVCDSVCRLVPGVLSDPECYIGESHWDGLLEYPQYTRPELWEGREVPEVLLSGDHEKIARWRRAQQLRRTRDRRPDLFAAFRAENDEDRRLMEELRRQEGRPHITKELVCRPAEEGDLPVILSIVDEARAFLKEKRVDQWQGAYPEDRDFLRDMLRGECHVVLHGDEITAVFTVSSAREPEYDDIRDGKWTPDLEACVLHRCAVRARWAGTGMADRMLRFAEKCSLDNGRRCLRTDTHPKNRSMLRLLSDNGYRYRGNIDIHCEPGHESIRRCYEKILKSHA